MKEGGSMVKAYVPFRFRYTPIVRTVLIRFRKDPDHLYNALELQVVNQDGQNYYRVLAERKDEYKDVYQDPRIQLDEGELELNIGGRGMGDVYPAEFTKGHFIEENGHVKIAFAFKDKESRVIDFEVDEDLEKETKHLSWLPSIGAKLENPESVPLFFLYDFDFIRKSGTDVKLTIGGIEHSIDPYAIPKDLQSRYNIQYSLNSVVTNFNESREAKMPMIDLDDQGVGYYKGKKYIYKIVDGDYNLERIILERPPIPVEVTFDPPFPDYTELDENIPWFGNFIIRPSEELGTLTGRYNVTKQNNNAIINLNFTEGWSPNEKELYYSLLRERHSNRLTDWYKAFQCTEILDLNTFETKVSWKKVDPERNKNA